MALAWGVKTSVTSVLNSSIMASLTSPPFSLARDFCSEPRWSIAAAAITPRSFDTAFRPASLPGVSFIKPPIAVTIIALRPDILNHSPCPEHEQFPGPARILLVTFRVLSRIPYSSNGLRRQPPHAKLVPRLPEGGARLGEADDRGL